MKSVGREEQLNDVLRQVRRSIDADGVFQPGRQVHVSVAAPQRGGLSLFLEDVREELSGESRLEAQLVEIHDSSAPEKDLLPVLQQLAHRAGLSEGISEFTIAKLFEVCDALFEREQRVLVLILDVGKALGEIETNPRLEREAKDNPLLYLLRYLGTLMEDREPKFATIVGWRSTFPPRSGDWNAEDVVQRYYPTIRLQPHFDKDDSRETWAIYREILERQGLEVEGSFPGFCRTDVSVGVVLDEAREKDQKGIDGRFLLEILRSGPTSDRDQTAITDDALIALCLRDEVVTKGHGVWDLVHEPACRRLVEIDGDRGYVATRELYERLGIRPPSVVLALEERTRFRFDQDRDPALSGEILEGLAAVLKTEPSILERFERFAFARMSVRNPAVLPEELGPGELELDVFCTLSEEPQPPTEMTQKVRASVYEIEREPGGITHRLVLVLSSEDCGRPLVTRITEGAEGAGVDLHEIRSQLQSGSTTLAALHCVRISTEDAIVALYATRDPEQDASRLEKGLGIRRHYGAIFKEWPQLVEADLSSGVLVALRSRSHFWVSLDDLKAELGLPDRVLKRAIKRLEAVGAIKSNKEAIREAFTGAPKPGVRWTFRDDALLDIVRRSAGSESEEVEGQLHSRFSFPRKDWIGLAKALADAYGDFLHWNGESLETKQPVQRLQRRALGILEELAARSRECGAKGSRGELNEIDEELSVLEDSAQRTESIAKLHEICEQAAHLLSRIDEVHARVRERREEIEGDIRTSLENLERVGESLDSDLLEERRRFLSGGDAESGDRPAFLDALKAFLKRCRQNHLLRTQNADDARSLLSHLSNLDKRLKGLLQRSEFSSVPVHASVAAIRPRLQEISIRISAWETRPPEDSANVVRGRLEADRGALEEMRAQTDALDRRVSISSSSSVSPRQRPSLSPPPSSSPQSPFSQSLSTPSPPSPQPTPPTSEPQSPPPPAPPSFEGQSPPPAPSSSDSLSPPPALALPPGEPVTGSLGAESPPPASTHVEEVKNDEEGLRRLAELLKSGRRILRVEIRVE